MDALVGYAIRYVNQLVDRFSGPLSFRFVLQPPMAGVLAVLAGLHDAETERPPFLRRAMSERDQRRALLWSGCRDVGRVFAFALVIDSAYQLFVLRFFYPLQALLVAGALAFVPYLVMRDLAARARSAFLRRRVGH